MDETDNTVEEAITLDAPKHISIRKLSPNPGKLFLKRKYGEAIFDLLVARRNAVVAGWVERGAYCWRALATGALRFRALTPDQWQSHVAVAIADAESLAPGMQCARLQTITLQRWLHASNATSWRGVIQAIDAYRTRAGLTRLRAALLMALVGSEVMQNGEVDHANPDQS